MGGKNRQVNYERDVIYGEGSDEVVFLKYLRSIYSKDSTNPRIGNGRGGTPKKIVQTMRDVPQLGAYNRRSVLFDSDRGEEKVNAAKMEAGKRPPITPVIAEQCFEYEMLKIKGVTGGILRKARQDSCIAKQEFARICDKSTDGSVKSYPKAYPKNLLESKRRTNTWLDSVIGLFE